MRNLLVVLIVIRITQVYSQVTPSILIYPRQSTVSISAFNLTARFIPWGDPSTVNVICQANVASTSTELENFLTTPPCKNSLGSGSSSGGRWNVDQNLQRDGFFMVRVSRSAAVSKESVEFVVVSCCANDSSRVEADAVVVVANVLPSSKIDWTKVTTTATEYKNPAFVNISPCPCDLTGNLCDINCCCDKDCSTTEVSSFSSCIPFLPGGQEAQVPEYKCSSQHVYKDEWFPLMCVEREYNALLGFYYSNNVGVKDMEAFLAKKYGEELFEYSENEARTPGDVITNYISGTPIRTLKNGEIAWESAVVLPHRVLSGECTLDSPLPFLLGRSSSCVWQVTSDKCHAASVLSAQSYLQPSALTTTHEFSYGVLGNVASKAAAPVVVEYYCTTGSNPAPYVKSSAGSPTPPTSTTTFDYTMPPANCQDECGDDKCRVSSHPQETLPPRCPWDDGLTAPPSASPDTSSCRNVVLDVHYEFEWQGQSIEQVKAKVILGSVSLNGIVTQKFESSFAYVGNITVAQDNYQNETSFTRSGFPGYDFGQPLQSGTMPSSGVDQNITEQLTVWDTGADGLCKNAGRRPLKFGQDVLSTCLVYLNASDLSNDCPELRKLFINRLNDMFSATLIGRYGNNNPTDKSHWVKIERDIPISLCQRSMTTITDDYRLSLAGTGRCVDMITGINLEIFYGETGKANGQPIYEVMNAYINYKNETMTISCTNGDPACTGSGVQAFPLTTHVNFIKIPGQTLEPKMKYFDTPSTGVCRYERCWKQAIYPLTDFYDGEEKTYVLAMTFISIVFGIGFLFITSPSWWGYI